MRRPELHSGHRVTPLELFFDLVFVLAITQLSHFLLKHFTPLGALQTAVLLLAVWWAWVFTSWVTNWLDPAHPPVRVMVMALMLIGLVMSAALPDAFGERGLVFALAYVTLQVGRSAFALWAMWGDPIQRRNFSRILSWLALAGVLWLAGGLASSEARLGWWLAALLLEYAGPAAGFALPGLGRSTTRDWAISGEHMAERAGLFVIIALGEGVLVTGATFAELQWTALTGVALGTTFIGSVVLWWTYFVVNAEVVAATIRRAEDPGALARFAYTYLHVPIVAGIVLSAVGHELVLTHPTGPADGVTRLAVLGGPAVFLLGNALFKRAAIGHLPLSHGLGVMALATLAIFGGAWPPVILSLLAATVLGGVALGERTGPDHSEERM